MGGKADVHGLHIGIIDSTEQFAILSNAGEVKLFTRAAEVSLDLAEVASKLLLVFARNGDDLGIRYTFVGFQVRRSHETESQDSDAHIQVYRSIRLPIRRLQDPFSSADDKMKELSMPALTECQAAVDKGLTAVQAGDLQRAQRAFGKAVAKAAVIPVEYAGDWPVYSRYLLANTLSEMGSVDEALHLGAEAFAMAKTVPDQHGWRPKLYELMAGLIKRAGKSKKDHDQAAATETNPMPAIIRSR